MILLTLVSNPDVYLTLIGYENGFRAEETARDRQAWDFVKSLNLRNQSSFYKLSDTVAFRKRMAAFLCPKVLKYTVLYDIIIIIFLIEKESHYGKLCSEVCAYSWQYA